MKNVKMFVTAVVAGLALFAARAAEEIKNGSEYALDGLPAEMTASVQRGGTVRFLLEENAAAGLAWEAAFSANECAVTVEHRAGDGGAPERAAVTIAKHASVQTPVLVEMRLASGKDAKPAKSLRVVAYTAPGEVPDFRYPKDGVTAELLAECKARGIVITDWHLHIRGGMTPEMAVERERASGILSSAMENHGREWEIFTNARLREFAAAARKANPAMPVGIQVNDRDWFRQIDPDTRAKFDYILADTMIMGRLPNGRDKRLWLVKDMADVGDPEKWMERYVAHNLQILDEPISILANPTYLPAPLAPMYDKLWTDVRMKAVISKAVARGIAIEVQAGSQFQTARFLMLAKKMGAKFSFGTNNFDPKPKDLSRWLWAIRLLDLHGADIWTPQTLAAARARNAQPHEFKFAADKPDCLYRCGEKATFTVTVLGADGHPATKGTVTATLDNFGPKEQAKRTVDLAQENPFRMEGSLAEPGFLRLTVETKGVKTAMFGVGYEPEKIETGSPSPADFDAFWAKAVADLDATVPADPQLKLLPERSQGAFNFWRISFATWGGTRVYGYLSIPKDASAEKKYPVRFQVPAAGNGRAHWTNNMQGADDAICMLVTVHPYEPPFNLDELEKLFKANVDGLQKKYGTSSYAVAGIAKSREDYYFYRALLGINRAVNWLAARPEVDLSHFTYSGTSQGGGFGFLLLGLNRHFTKGVMYVPAITDTMGYLKGRRSGWPRIVEGQREEERTAAERNAPYFDGANFAARIACPVRVAVGFADNTCPPCAVYAAYNAIPVKDKKIVHGIGMTHACFGKFYSELGQWQKEK